jgi:hypothetical protein
MSAAARAAPTCMISITVCSSRPSTLATLKKHARAPLPTYLPANQWGVDTPARLMCWTLTPAGMMMPWPGNRLTTTPSLVSSFTICTGARTGQGCPEQVTADTGPGPAAAPVPSDQALQGCRTVGGSSTQGPGSGTGRQDTAAVASVPTGSYINTENGQRLHRA